MSSEDIKYILNIYIKYDVSIAYEEKYETLEKAREMARKLKSENKQIRYITIYRINYDEKQIKILREKFEDVI